MKMILLSLPCANEEEAEKIAKALLEKKLIVCAKRAPVISMYYWKNEIVSDNEVLLTMESVEENFDKIEKEVGKLHSYETFVLTSTPVTKYSEGVEEWMKEGLEK